MPGGYHSYPEAADPTWGAALRAQLRVIAALLRREMRAHFGERRLGYLWAILEPTAHLWVLTTLFVYVFHRHNPVGGDLRLFFLSGLIPYFTYWKVASYLVGAVSNNRALLNIPVVKIFDVIVARAVLEAVTELFVAALLFAGLFLLGVTAALPADPIALFEAIVVLFVFALGFGMINAVMRAFIVNWGFFLYTILGPLYLLSGIFFLVEEVPSPLRDYLLYNPVVHFIIWFRLGFYPYYPAAYLDRFYAVGCAAAALVAGLALLRAARRKLLEPE